MKKYMSLFAAVVFVSLLGCDDSDDPVERAAEQYCATESFCRDTDMMGCMEDMQELVASVHNAGPVCEDSWVELMGCIWALDCDQFEEYWWTDPAEPYPCKDQDIDYKTNCDMG